MAENLTPNTEALAMARVWTLAKEYAASGIARGITGTADLSAVCLMVACNSRGPLELLTAQAIALDGIRAARAKAGLSHNAGRCPCCGRGAVDAR